MNLRGETAPPEPAPLPSNETPNPWVSSGGVPSHPDAPAGSGGPGVFRPAAHVDGPGGRSESLPHPATQQGKQHQLSDDEQVTLNKSATVPTTATVPLKTNPPPVTKAEARSITRTQGTTVTKVTVQILADTTSGSVAGEAHTGIDTLAVVQTDPAIQLDANNIVIAETSRATFSGTLSIQTKYKPGAKPEGKSAYGRGKTKADVTNGDVTLGFHESCHRKDFFDWYTTKSFPQFKGKAKMTLTNYDKKLEEWKAAWKQFGKDASAASYQSTDNVGDPTESQHSAGNP